MKRKIIILGSVIMFAMNLFGCSSSDRSEETRLPSQNVLIVAERKTRGARGIGTPDPSAVYCTRLGYKYEIVADDEGGQFDLLFIIDDLRFYS